MHRALPAHVTDYVGPAIGGLVFILLVSLLKQPTRRHFNAIFVAGAMGAYISGGGLGLWEFAFAAVGSLVAFHGLRSHRFIGIAWLLHSAWDLAHHFFANPIWPFLETSSFGCCVCDVVIAAWFFMGAPSGVEMLRGRSAVILNRLRPSAQNISVGKGGAVVPETTFGDAQQHWRA